jgi:hypothetical protein
MDVPRGTARRAHEIARQRLGGDNAGVAAGAGDLEHHRCCFAPRRSGEELNAIGECASRSLFEYRSTHENADADEQEHHDDEEQGHGVAPASVTKKPLVHSPRG